MKNLFARFVREDAGQDLIEYAVLLGLITVGAVAAIGSLGTWVTGKFGYGAPILTQATRSAIRDSLSLPSLGGGIFNSSFW